MLHYRLDLEYDLRKNYEPATRSQVNSRLVAANHFNLLKSLRKAWRTLINRIDDSLYGFGAGTSDMQVNV